MYRQEKDWLQYGFALSRTTMANWVISCAVTYLKVLYDYCHRLLVERGFAMADETPVQVLKEEGRDATFSMQSPKGNSVISAILQYRVWSAATNCLLMSGISKKKATHSSRLKTVVSNTKSR